MELKVHITLNFCVQYLWTYTQRGHITGWCGAFIFCKFFRIPHTFSESLLSHTMERVFRFLYTLFPALLFSFLIFTLCGKNWNLTVNLLVFFLMKFNTILFSFCPLLCNIWRNIHWSSFTFNFYLCSFLHFNWYIEIKGVHINRVSHYGSIYVSLYNVLITINAFIAWNIYLLYDYDIQNTFFNLFWMYSPLLLCIIDNVTTFCILENTTISRLVLWDSSIHMDSGFPSNKKRIKILTLRSNPYDMQNG
jgi:hypothetical protein